MSLPVMTAPTYVVKLLSVPTPVTYRPYVVKEEKLLLMAQQSEDTEEIERAVKQVLRNCTDGKVDIEKLASFDLEYLFLQIRAKSVNNIVTVNFQCKNPVPDAMNTGNQVCGTIVPIEINLDDVKMVIPEGHTSRIMLSNDIGVTLRYPTAKKYNAVGDITDLLVECLATIFTSTGEVHELSETGETEIRAFVDSLTPQQIDKIKPFFVTLPHLSHTAVFSCPKCKYQETLVFTGLLDFFD